MISADVPPPLEVSPARRIFGLETEFGLHLDTAVTRPVTPEEVAGHLFHSVVQWGRSSNVFLTNGSRLYIDVGAHPEYATAEADNLTDLIALDKAGERIVQDLVAGGQERLRATGVEGTIHLYKNNTDSSGNSYGCHENYLVRRRADFKAFASDLLPFLVTRQIVTGAGCITRTPQGAHFSFSPRADHMWEGMSSATTRSRPMINTRDEPHANAELYRRMHVIVGDSTMAEPTTLLKMGSTDLILRIMEARIEMPGLALAREMQAIRDVAHDLTGKATVELADGRHLTAVEVQQAYLDLVVSHVGGIIAPNDEVSAIVDLWQRGIDAVRTQDFSLVETELDWAIKHKIVTRYQGATGLRARRPAPRAPRARVPRRLAGARPVLSLAGTGPRAARRDRRADRGGEDHRALVDAGALARPVRDGSAGGRARLHRRLGAPEVDRRGVPHGVAQGPVPQCGRAGRRTHRFALDAPASIYWKVRLLPPSGEIEMRRHAAAMLLAVAAAAHPWGLHAGRPRGVVVRWRCLPISTTSMSAVRCARANDHPA